MSAALTALLDGAMTVAARERAGGEVAIVELHIAFVQDAAGEVCAAARVNGGGRSVCFCEAEATDASGRLVARAVGTFRRRAAI
jgi:acyl-coenzyme A thioesterase PaaI-like protein